MAETAGILLMPDPSLLACPPSPRRRTGLAGRHLREAIARAEPRESPFCHWLIRNALPRPMVEALARLPIPPAGTADNAGRRETRNAERVYVTPEMQRRLPATRPLACTLQAAKTVRTIEEHCRIQLAGTRLRIEYCQDQDGFWLEPHTDIGVKKFTMLVYLSAGPGTEDWGTDLYDANGRRVGTVPFERNAGLIFIPGGDTWHGFEKRPIPGIRKSIIVNYVGPEWRSVDELAFPNEPV
jgi:hypothetical protein